MDKKEKSRVVTGKEICGVCNKTIFIVVDNNYDNTIGYTAVKAENASLCDFADDDGCFKHYHDECFSKHSCKAFSKKIKQS